MPRSFTKGGGGGGGGIGGSTGSTDNAILRADGTGGATVQGSGVAIDDNAGISQTILNASTVGAVTTAAAAQSANLREWRNSGGTLIAAISATGALSLNSITDTLSGNLTISNGAGNSVFITGGGDGGASVNYTRRFNIATPSFSINSPSQITADQNNYTFSGSFGRYLRLSSDASRNITGLANTWGSLVTNWPGDTLTIINVGSNDIVLVHQSASSTATNRFLNSTGADITLSANQAADLFYDDTTQRWRVFKHN